MVQPLGLEDDPAALASWERDLPPAGPELVVVIRRFGIPETALTPDAPPGIRVVLH